MAMTRKDFVRIAQVFRANKPPAYLNCDDNPAYEVWDSMIEDMILEFRASHPHFDANRFRVACERPG